MATYSDTPHISDKDNIRSWLIKYRSVSSTGCWEWTRSTSGKGYGYISLRGLNNRHMYVHRLSAYVFMNFDLYSELLVLHKCDNPLCFNPEHLFIGNNSDNIQDCIKKGRYNYSGRNKGEQVNTAKLTENDVIRIRNEYDGAETFESIAHRYNVTGANIRYILMGITWKHLKGE